MRHKKRRVFIVSACRTPIGNFNGMFKDYSAVDLGAAALRGVIQKTDTDKKVFLSSSYFQQTNVFMGNVLSAGLGQNPARQAAYKAGFSRESPCVTLNKVCGSGMQAILCAYDAIKSGRIDLAFAGGMESMTNAPYLSERPWFKNKKGEFIKSVGDFLESDFRDKFIQGEAYYGNNENITFVDSIMRDGLVDAYSGGKMIQVADECATGFGITRCEQDDYARRSNEWAIRATKLGLFKNEIVAVGDFSEDEGIKLFKPEKIPELPPLIKNGTITAANASKISDGAAVLIIASEEIVERFKMAPLAEIIDIIEHSGFPEDFPIAPSRAIGRLLEQNKLILENINLIEINEAFAVVPLIFEKSIHNNENMEKINLNGGAVALGHPIGASGARIVVSLVYALSRNELGIASVCIGGGEALAMLVKKV